MPEQFWQQAASLLTATGLFALVIAGWLWADRFFRRDKSTAGGFLDWLYIVLLFLVVASAGEFLF